MEPNEEGVTPRRRSLVPGASQEIPVAPDAEDIEASYAPTGQAYADQAYADQPHAPTEVYQAFGVEEPLPPAHVEPGHAQAVPWFRRTWVIATAAGAVFLGVAIGVIVALTGGGTPLAAPSVSPSPTDTSPSPSASAEPTVATLLDDGIAADEYPAAAPRVGADYPEALVMEDWVWDRVGPTWTLLSVGNFDASEGTSSPSVIYLASPEGVLFDLVHVNESRAVAQIVSWLPSERQARIQIMPFGYDTSADGALVDLETGAIEEMSFSTDAGRSTMESFLAATSSGSELWSAQDANYQSVRFESWTRASGWTRVLSEPDISPWNVVASPDGSFVASEIFSTDDSGFRSARSGPPGQPAFAILNVDTGVQTVLRPLYEATATRWCNLYAVTDDGLPILSCWNDSYDDQIWRMATDGKPLSELSDDAVQLPMNFWDLTSADLPDVGISLVSAASDSQVYEVAVESDGSSVPVLKAGVDIPYGGLTRFYAAKVVDGVTLVRATEACAIIDTENAHGVPLATSKNGIVSCIAYGQGNGISPAYPYWGEGG